MEFEIFSAMCQCFKSHQVANELGKTLYSFADGLRKIGLLKLGF